MSQHQRGLDSRRPLLDSCTSQLHRWKPFHPPSTSQTLESIDISNLSLLDHDRRTIAAVSCKRTNHYPQLLHWVPRKRRRKSRSVSSDCSLTRRCCSVGATCSDFPMAAGTATDSSGELFFNGESHWANDVGDAKGGEKEVVGFGCGQRGDFEGLGNDSGYGSEPGYRGDAEFGYGDEVEEEEDDQKPLFWDKRAEAGETFSEQKVHYRGRRKKHDWKLVDMMMG